MKPPPSIELPSCQDESLISILSSHEAERQRLSEHLNNDIAQYLLGIHMRLLVLKRSIRDSHACVVREIAVTERLVAESMSIIHQFAQANSIQHEN